MTTRTMNVRIPEALYGQIEELARATARTKSFLAIEALKGYVESESWQVRDIRAGIAEADAGDFASPEEVAATFAKPLASAFAHVGPETVLDRQLVDSCCDCGWHRLRLCCGIRKKWNYRRTHLGRQRIRRT